MTKEWDINLNKKTLVGIERLLIILAIIILMGASFFAGIQICKLYNELRYFNFEYVDEFNKPTNSPVPDVSFQENTVSQREDNRQADIQGGQVLEATVTAYCLNKNPMASGKMPYDGAIACPRSIPLGTLIIIDDMGYTCEDRLSLKYDDRYDLWMESCDECMKFGKQTKQIKILKVQD